MELRSSGLMASAFTHWARDTYFLLFMTMCFSNVSFQVMPRRIFQGTSYFLHLFLLTTALWVGSNYHYFRTTTQKKNCTSFNFYFFLISREGIRSCMVFSSNVCFGTFLFPLICSNPDTAGSLWAPSSLSYTFMQLLEICSFYEHERSQTPQLN